MFVALLATVLVAEFLIDLEMFATASVVGGLVLASAIAFSAQEVRHRLLQTAAAMAAAFAICAACEPVPVLLPVFREASSAAVAVGKILHRPAELHHSDPADPGRRRFPRSRADFAASRQRDGARRLHRAATDS